MNKNEALILSLIPEPGDEVDWLTIFDLTEGGGPTLNLLTNAMIRLQHRGSIVVGGLDEGVLRIF